MFTPAPVPSPIPTPAGPAPDATVYRLGRRRLRTGLPGTLIMVVAGPLPLVLTAAKGGGSVGSWVFGGVWLLLVGGLGVLMAWALWAGRGSLLAFDAYGVWWRPRGSRQAVLPWQSLAGVGLYWASKGDAKSGHKVMSLELCPYGDVNEADPVLKPLVVQYQPLRPGLPERRYRIAIPMYASRAWGRELAGAAYARAPQLWFGEHEQPSDYMSPLRSSR